MSTKDPGQNLGVDPSEKTTGGASNPDQQKEKDKDGGEGKGTDGPTASSKGINPVQHSE